MSNARFSIAPAIAAADTALPDTVFRTLACLGVFGDKNGWCWPSLETIAKMRGVSKSRISQDIKILVERGYVQKQAQFKNNEQQTNRYRLLFDMDGLIPEVNPPLTPEVNPPLIAGVNQNDPVNAPANAPAGKKDLVDGILELAQMPGVKKSIRLDAIASQIKVRFGIEPTRRTWLDFMHHADKRQQEHGESLTVFFDWLEGQKNFDVSYWPPLKMQENWPRAFMVRRTEPDEGFIFAPEEPAGKYIPAPTKWRPSP